MFHFSELITKLPQFVRVATIWDISKCKISKEKQKTDCRVAPRNDRKREILWLALLAQADKRVYCRGIPVDI